MQGIREISSLRRATLAITRKNKKDNEYYLNDAREAKQNKLIGWEKWVNTGSPKAVILLIKTHYKSTGIPKIRKSIDEYIENWEQKEYEIMNITTKYYKQAEKLNNDKEISIESDIAKEECLQNYKNSNVLEKTLIDNLQI